MPLPAPAGYGSRSLADLLPSLASGIGVPGLPNVLGVGPCSSALMLLVDGLGAALIEEHADCAPTLSALVAGRSLDAGFPASTSISVASLGTGLPPGAHGLVGLTMQHDGDVLDTLKWTMNGRDATPRAVPEQIQPHPTVFDQVRAAGLRPVVVSAMAFRQSSLTRAALRGADYLGTVAHGDLASVALDAVARPGSLVYAYISELDTVGHVHGPGSEAWRLQLREVDFVVGLLLDRLPPGVALAVTGDHGMVTMPAEATVDFDNHPGLQEDVVLLAGEPRVRYVHVRPGTEDAVRRRWTETLGDGFWLGSRREVLAGGWLGPEVSADVAQRVGDLVVVALENGGVVRRSVEPVVSRLLGQHGSWTDAERRVALALHRA
ncbi:MAG TPA: alkaline phosphatase family protein [Frankiaceae bacterium]|nr:alkaline phosphatase family protein [Frankiaceae bacterium]